MVKRSKFMPAITFSKAVQWARLASLPGQFCPPSLMFDAPSAQLLCATVMTLMKLDAISFKHYY